METKIDFILIMVRISIDLRNGDEALQFLKQYIRHIDKVNVNIIKMAKKVFNLYINSEFMAI